MSSLLDTSCINARQLSACVLREKTGAVQLLKLSLGIFLLLAALCVLPAGAESFESDGLPERNYLTAGGEGAQDCRFVFNTFTETEASVSTVRETKTRTAQKKNQIPPVEYQSYADEKGEVFFAESPVVTGMHIPVGTAGRVSLLPEPVSAGPQCQEVYGVFAISIENYPEGYESSIRYTLSLAEIEDKGFSPADVCLCFHDGDSWVMLPTEYYMDETRVFFESVTTALGEFAIVSKDCAAETDQVMLRSKSLEYPQVSITLTPVSILTHPYSYTASAG